MDKNPSHPRWRLRAALACAAAALAACASRGGPPAARMPSIPTAGQVDLARFMGDWYVIAHVPTWPERAAFNAVETYALREDGRIATRFRYRHGGFDAPVSTMHPVGTVRPGTGNAVWDMQFLWPFQAEYVIAELSPDGQRTLIARSDRDYAWLMARTPQIAPQDYEQAMARLQALGYDLEKVRRVPQRWPESGPDAAPQPPAHEAPARERAR
ncbi:MAG: lipocalin family protein [Comamonadaceae bacterium]|jgi:apolipoprotein D and lipocalin family protein|nr:lipocalin family protein [Comamonadaceae bacterium]